MMMALDSAVRADGLHFICEYVIVGEQGASIAIATQRFGWEKASAANRGDPTTAAAALSGAETLSVILDNWQAMVIGNGVDASIIRHLSEQAHGQNGFGAR